MDRAALLARAATYGTPRPELEAAVAVLGAGQNRARILRAAHAQVNRLREAGEPVPFWLRLLECEYQAAHPRRKPAPVDLRRRPASGSPEVGAAIRDARGRAGLSQNRLAAAAGVTRRCVQMWETAKRTPGPQSWTQLELTLGPLGIVREQDPEPGAEGATRAA
jgi:Helix-turn-helix